MKIFLFLLPLLFSFPALAAVAPEAVVSELYAARAKEFKNPKADPLYNGGRTKYLSARLVHLLDADAEYSAKTGDVGHLDGDILYDAQDFDISHLAVAPGTLTAQGADVTVDFDNFKEHHTLVLHLIQEQGSWKIDDIDYRVPPPAWSLVHMLSEPY